MAPVAETRTQTDAYLEQRKVREGNAVLVQQRDTLMREIAQWQPVLHAIREEIAAHLGLPEITQELDALLSTQLMEKRDALQREIDEKTAKGQDLDVQNQLKEKQVTAQDATIEAKTALVATLSTDADKYHRLAVAAHADHSDALLKAQNELVPAQEAVLQARNHLTGVQLEEEVLLQNRQAEDIRLAKKGGDLAIYEARIRKMAVAVGMDPNNIIV